jgi:hypothetical protein
LVVWNMNFIFHNIWDNPSHWRSYFSRLLKPPTRYLCRFFPEIWSSVSDEWLHVSYSFNFLGDFFTVSCHTLCGISNTWHFVDPRRCQCKPKNTMNLAGLSKKRFLDYYRFIIGWKTR